MTTTAKLLLHRSFYKLWLNCRLLLSHSSCIARYCRCECVQSASRFGTHYCANKTSLPNGHLLNDVKQYVSLECRRPLYNTVEVIWWHFISWGDYVFYCDYPSLNRRFYTNVNFNYKKLTFNWIEHITSTEEQLDIREWRTLVVPSKVSIVLSCAEMKENIVHICALSTKVSICQEL